MSKAQKKKSRQRMQVALLVGLGTLVLWQAWQMHGVKKDLAFVDGLSQREAGVTQELSEGKQYLSVFGQDLNEIRSLLNLPAKNYSFGEDEVELAGEVDSEDLTEELFTFVEKLGTYEKNEARFEENLSAFQTALEDGYWAGKGLYVDNAGEVTSDAQIFSFENTAGAELFSVSLGYDGLFSLSSLDPAWELDDKESSAEVVNQLQAYVDSQLDDLKAMVQALADARAALATLMTSSAVQAALVEQGLTASTELASPDTYYYEIKNGEALDVARVKLAREGAELELQIAQPVGDFDKNIDLSEDAQNRLVEAISGGIDGRTTVQKLVEERRSEMESVFADRAFKAVLQEMNLQMGITSETDARISYPILREDGQTLRTIFIDKTTGEVRVESSDGSQTLSMAIQAIDISGKKKLSTPLYC
jgi:hypothetical protein